MLPPAGDERRQAGWVDPHVFSWSCAPTLFESKDENGDYERCDPLSEQMAGGYTTSTDPTAASAWLGRCSIPPRRPGRCTGSCRDHRAARTCRPSRAAGWLAEAADGAWAHRPQLRRHRRPQHSEGQGMTEREKSGEDLGREVVCVGWVGVGTIAIGLTLPKASTAGTR